MTIFLIIFGVILLIVGFLGFCYIVGLREIYKGHQKFINKVIEEGEKIEE